MDDEITSIIFPLNNDKTLSLNKLLAIFEIVNQIDTFDNRGEIDFLTVYQFIYDNLNENASLGLELSNILLKRITHIFFCSIWYEHCIDKNIFSEAIKLGTGVGYPLTKNESDKINILIKELSSVFNEEGNLEHLQDAKNTVKKIILNKLILNENSVDVETFSNKIEVRLWVKKKTVERLLFFNVCKPKIMKTVLETLPYGIIKNKNEFCDYKYEFTMKTFNMVLKSFNFDVKCLELDIYTNFMKVMNYRDSSIDTSKQFLIALLPNYDTIWSRLKLNLHPMVVENLIKFNQEYIISQEEMIKLICLN
jgi:hypothetical protein